MLRAHGPMWSATNARCGAKCWEGKGGQATFGLPLRRNSWSTLRGLREFDAVFLGRDAIFGVRCGVLGRDAALLGRALATLGTAPTKIAVASLAN